MAGENPDQPRSRKRVLTSRRGFAPSRSVALVDQRGVADLPPSSIVANNVGCKAVGLCVLPAEWTPPYFIVSSRCFDGKIARSTLGGWISESLSIIGLSADHAVMIRSSGTGETLRDRGSLISKSCKASEMFSTIDDLRAATQTTAAESVHWIVQEAILPRRKGHFSNERRVSREPRDWVVEFEGSTDHRAYTASLGVRTWRDGSESSTSKLQCGSETEITLRLRQVARWGMQFSTRLHYEWVWDGQCLWIVQADAEEPTKGQDPTILSASLPNIEVGALRVFRLATEADYTQYGKLANAALYRRLGYEMPPFFIADDITVVNELLQGIARQDLEHDLTQLIQRPLMIRTDGSNIPEGKREMLPRSEPLTSLSEAKEWLAKHFKDEIEKLDLANGGLCLITHHFIPSVASAWARAEPESRIVRVEALWGIPEGLYWYSHDTFEVDTQSVSLPLFKSSKSNYRISGLTKATVVPSGKLSRSIICSAIHWRTARKLCSRCPFKSGLGC
jgi:hypothetical protein